jgi:hypothetical protein
MRTYHGSIAVGHYTRLLGGKPQPIAVLYAMWLQARDPFAENVHVKLSLTQLEGLVPHAARLRQLISQLKDVGAVERAEFGFKLCKPDDTELDESARALLESAQRVTGNGVVKLPARAKPTTSANEMLAGLDKQRSDVRDVIAKMAGLKPSALTYSGPGSLPVQAAIDWLTETGATWDRFVSVCARVHKDKSADRPKSVQYLFEYKPDKRAYLERMLDPAIKTQDDAPLPVAKSLEEQQLDALTEYGKYATDKELPAIAARLEIPDDMFARYLATRAAQIEAAPQRKAKSV